MKPLIASPEDAARLCLEARAWIDTPYVPDGAIKGAGASCSSLPWAILRDFGHNAPEIPRRLGLAKVELLPTMKSWLAAHPEFYRPVPFEERQPGDVVLVDAGIGHLLLMVDRDEVVHSWQTRGVHASHVATVSNRIVGVWRPVIPE